LRQQLKRLRVKVIVKLKKYHYLAALVVIVKLLLKLRIKSQLKRLKIQLAKRPK